MLNTFTNILKDRHYIKITKIEGRDIFFEVKGLEDRYFYLAIKKMDSDPYTPIAEISCYFRSIVDYVIANTYIFNFADLDKILWGITSTLNT